jgi:dihydroorotate dehydrogenase electron transfer subunit
MHQAKAKVLSNEKVGKAHYRMKLEVSQIAKDARPGQFVHIRCSSGYDPLLRRPFSIHKRAQGRIDILYQVVGRGTGILSKKRRGEELDLLGPLGKGFEIESAFSKIFIISGGMGVAPLYMVAQEITRLGQGKEVTALLGAKNKELILDKDALESLGLRVMTATEDGSEGYQGLVSDLFERLISSQTSLSVAVYSCGPVSMLKKIAEVSSHQGFFCQVSLEQRMGCGLGACLGCVIRGISGYLRVCKEGPVFDAQEILWDDPCLEIE